MDVCPTLFYNPHLIDAMTTAVPAAKATNAANPDPEDLATGPWPGHSLLDASHLDMGY